MLIRPKRPEDDWLDHIFRYVSPAIAILAILLTLLIVPLGTLAISILEYLRTGHWMVISSASLTEFRLTTEWIGLDNIVNWLLALWVGWPSLLVGWVVFRVWLDSDL